MRRLETLAAALILLMLTTAMGCRGRTSARPSEGEGAGEPGADVEAVPPMPAEGFAVLPWGTRVYVEPRLGGLSVQLGSSFVSPPPWPTTGQVVRVVGERDGFVEIAPLLEEDLQQGQHCGGVLLGEELDVRLYVSPWSPALVLTREHDEVDAHGRVLALRPGAVVQRIPEDHEGAWAIAAGGIMVRAQLPEDALGRSYERPQPLELPTSQNWQLDETIGMTYRGWPVAFDPMSRGGVAIASAAPDGEGHRVEIVSACGRVTAEAPRMPAPWSDRPQLDFEFGLGAADVVLPGVPLVDDLGLTLIAPELPPEPPPPTERTFEFLDVEDIEGELLQPSSVFVGLVSDPRREWVFEEDAPIYLSPGGPMAGTLDTMRVFGEDAWLAGDRLCFRTSFGSRFVPALAVCLDGVEGRLRDPTIVAHDFQPKSVRPGSLRINGGLDEAEVARALRLHRHELRLCVLRGSPPDGRLVLTLAVSRTGRVSPLRVHATALMGSVEGCAEEAARTWTMPAPTDGKPATVEFSVEIHTGSLGGGFG